MPKGELSAAVQTTGRDETTGRKIVETTAASSGLAAASSFPNFSSGSSASTGSSGLGEPVLRDISLELQLRQQQFEEHILQRELELRDREEAVERRMQQIEERLASIKVETASSTPSTSSSSSSSSSSASNSASRASSYRCPKDLPKWADYSGNPRGFLDKVAIVCRAHGTDISNYSRFIRLTWDDMVTHWFDSSVGNTKSWSDFKQLFIEHFGGSYAEQLALVKLSDIAQRDRSVQEYGDDFTKYAKQVDKTVNASTLSFFFKKGLKKELSAAITSFEFVLLQGKGRLPSLNEYISAAQMAEANINMTRNINDSCSSTTSIQRSTGLSGTGSSGSLGTGSTGSAGTGSTRSTVKTNLSCHYCGF